jgi:sugar lactone lactonase YvrE
MYYVDSPTRRIDWFDFDVETGRIEGRRTFVEIEEGAGFPDGLTVDAEGNVWVALWGGSAVRCYSAKGTLEGVARVGASQASSCTFGGEGFRDLYVTSARTGLSTETLAAEPAAGGLFVVRPGVAGRACRRYRG